MIERHGLAFDDRLGQLAARLSRRRLIVSAGAMMAIAGSGLPGVAGARQATPVASPVPGGEAMGEDQLAFLVQFIHPEKFFAAFGGGLDETLSGALLGLDVETYRRIKRDFDASARRAAEELLADPDFAARVDRLPVPPGGTIVGVGDSITDDLQSWLEIVRHLLELRRPDDQIRVINQGISGDTTTDVLGRFVPITATQPAWIVCMLGTNDAGRFGPPPTKTRVSLEETAKNLAELRRLAAAETGASWVWLTPPPCDEDVVAASPLFQQAQLIVRNDDLVAIADVVRRQPEPVVDLVSLFGRSPAPELMLPDGLHPSLAGHQAIARALVERLTA